MEVQFYNTAELYFYVECVVIYHILSAAYFSFFL